MGDRGWWAAGRAADQAPVYWFYHEPAVGFGDHIETLTDGARGILRGFGRPGGSACTNEQRLRGYVWKL